MAGKKDFSGMNTGRVYGAVEQATSRKGQQGTASPQEAAARAADLKTQGRKGCKAARINMAFTPENHEYITVMARLTGKSMTEFCNLVIQKYREANPDIYEKAKSVLDAIDGGAANG